MLPQPKPGERRCLKCGRVFKSVDLVTNRICSKCNKDNQKTFTPRTVSSSSCGEIETKDIDY